VYIIIECNYDSFSTLIIEFSWSLQICVHLRLTSHVPDNWENNIQLAMENKSIK